MSSPPLSDLNLDTSHSTDLSDVFASSPPRFGFGPGSRSPQGPTGLSTEPAKELDPIPSVRDCRSSDDSTQPRIPEQSQFRDLARLKRVHTTEGYRDGISASKATHVQAGFDEGFALGAVLGSAAGRILGVLDGMVMALGQRPTDVPQPTRTHMSDGEQSDELGKDSKAHVEAVAEPIIASTAKERQDSNPVDIDEKEGDKSPVARPDDKRVRHLLDTAKTELSVKSLFGQTYFGPDGVWLFAVDEIHDGGDDGEDGGGDDGEADRRSADRDNEAHVTFDHVAACHPLIRKWNATVRELTS